MKKYWKGKSTDILLLFFYCIIYGCGIHILVAIRHALRHDENIVDSILSPGNLLLALVVFFIFASPFWVYLRKVPKSIAIDSINSKLIIK